jgi:hypothetical protein
MNVRRFVLRLAVAIITFIIGFAAATLFGASRPARFAATTTTTRLVIVRDFDDEAITPHFEHSPLPPCGSFRMRHAFGWSDRHWDDSDFEPPLSPPPPAQHRTR